MVGVERLLDTREVGRRLGGAHPNDVLALIRSGRLAAKCLTIRGEGKRPRKYVPESELDRFIRELPDANEPVTPEAQPKPKSGRGRKPEKPAGFRDYY